MSLVYLNNRYRRRHVNTGSQVVVRSGRDAPDLPTRATAGIREASRTRALKVGAQNAHLDPRRTLGSPLRAAPEPAICALPTGRRRAVGGTRLRGSIIW